MYIVPYFQVCIVTACLSTNSPGGWASQASVDSSTRHQKAGVAGGSETSLAGTDSGTQWRETSFRQNGTNMYPSYKKDCGQKLPKTSVIPNQNAQVFAEPKAGNFFYCKMKIFTYLYKRDALEKGKHCNVVHK